ncbi:cupin domain-containing protein [Christiangramia echinicola]|uniref:cupin domain-containing protein n=1 Tax=Christiangramia echinicola TaxID=279359 RepID=UPI0003FEFA05|nr:cupin domain-containing protein [Christiangramia echinicola]
MKTFNQIIKRSLILFLLLPFINLNAQDAAKIDPAHYNVEVDNDKVRVLRIKYGPGEESKMHTHPEGVAVFLTDHIAEMKTGDGKNMEMTGNAGDVLWVDQSKHQPKNTGNKPFEVIQIELKNSTTAAGKKSLHLFELPEGVSEKQLNDFLKEMNKAISDEGYPEAGYHLYKITDNNDEYKYFMEGVWPDSATYDIIHNSAKWKAAAEKGKDIVDKIRAQELYLKAERVK